MKQVFLTTAIVFLFSVTSYPGQKSFSGSGNGAWQYSETIVIKNGPVRLDDYQVFISSSVLNTGKLINDDMLQPDLDDVRFEDENNNELPYCVSPDTLSPAGFWVRLPWINVSTSTTVSFYYGNSSATATSDAHGTFLFFDDFNNLGKWKTRKGSWEVLDGVLYSFGNELNTLRNSRKTNHSGIHISLRAKSKENNDIYFEWKKNGRNCYGINFSSTTPGITKIRKSKTIGELPIAPVQTNNWLTYEVMDFNGRIETNYASKTAVFIDTQPYVSGNYFTLNSTGETGFDTITLRNYVHPEPAAYVERALIALTPRNLLCEGKINPSGVVDNTPDFSWDSDYSGGYDHEEILQYAYKILVTTSTTDLNMNQGTVWDSGRVTGHENKCEYTGRRFLQGSTYFWKIMTWITETASSTYSETRHFDYAFNNPPDKPENLLCDGLPNPENMTRIKPELSWKFSDPDPMSSQEFYRLLVSLSIEELNENTGSVWDSEKTASLKPGVKYPGVPLISDTTYFWKVMTWDDGSSSGTYSAAGAFCFIYDPTLYPEPVENLRAVSLKGRRIKVEWLPSKSKDTAGYTLLYSTGEFDTSYSVYEEQLRKEDTSWTSPPLEESVMYSFIVRTHNMTDYQENNDSIVTATAFKKPPEETKILVSAPRNGRKISGNRFTLLSETAGAGKKNKIHFEFRKPGNRQWLQLSDSFQPKDKSGYACFWDLSTLKKGRYYLRTVTEDSRGKKHPGYSYMTVVIDHDSPDTEETATDTSLRKIMKLDNRIDNKVKLLKKSNSSITEVFLPAGSLSSSAATLTLVDNPAEVPENTDFEMIPVGEFRQIILDGAQLNKPAVIKIPYSDDDANGIIDGVTPPVLEYDLKPFVYNPELAVWEMIVDFELDRENDIIVFNVDHFSLFSLMGRGLTTLKHPFNYPNPFGEEGTSIIYELAEDSDVTIKIYTVAKRLVRVLLDNEPRTIGVQEESWDGTDASGESLANGSYLYRIVVNTSSGKTLQKIEKLVIMK